MAGINLILNKPSLQRTNLLWLKGNSIFSLPQLNEHGITFRLNKLYATYPIHSFEFNGNYAMLEGMVYNESISEIEKVIKLLFNEEIVNFNAVQQTICKWTGEWCIWVQKGSNLYVVNDVLGRLPIYWYQSEMHFYIGRHLALLNQNNLLIPDKMSVASLMWSGYLIGHRTIYKNVKRLPGGSFVGINLSTGDAIVEAGNQLNFDERTNQPLKQQAEHLADLFNQACNRIATSWQGVINISQSGGQDSRAVAAAFSKANVGNRLIASSFVMHGAEKDAALGKTIAEALHIPFSVYHVQGDKQLEDEILANKMGMNYVGMAFIHDFYKQMLQKNSDFLYVTGDGGDKALPYLGEKNKPANIDQLVVQLSQRHATTPIEKVAAITGQQTDDIRQMIYETVSTYPEQNLNNRSVHFTIYERAVQCFFEGEDRSRYFAWATTPFYDLDFFNAAMKVPDEYKKHYTIYRPFQNALNKTIADIPDASGYSINNWKFIARKRIQELFRSAPPVVKNLVRKLGGVGISINKGTQADHDILMEQLAQFTLLNPLLDLEQVSAFIKTANEEQYQYLRTLILLDKFINPYS